MAVEMMTWARRQVFPAYDLNGSERFVLFLLADNASWSDEVEQWYAYPLLKTLVRDSGLSQSTVQRALARFEELGLISRQRRYRPSGAPAGNGYFLHTESVESPIAKTNESPDKSRVVTMTSLQDTGGHEPVDNPSEPREFKSGHHDQSHAGVVTMTTGSGHHDQSHARYSSARPSLTVNEPSSSSSGSSDRDQDVSPDGTGETTKTARASHDETGGGRSQVRFGMHRPGNATGTVNLDRVAATVTGWGVTPDRDRLIWLVEAICDRSARAVHSPGSFVRTALRSQSGREWAQAMAEEFVVDDRLEEPDQGPVTGGHERGQKTKCPLPDHAASGYLRVNCPECRIHHAWPSVLDWEIYEQMSAEIRALVDAELAVTVTVRPDMTADSGRTHGARTPVTTDRPRPSAVRSSDRTAGADEVEVTDDDRGCGRGHRRFG